MYVFHPRGDSIRGTTKKDIWLDGILNGLHNPKPPEWWLDSQQREEGRSREQASIIWARHYKPARKYLIWAQSPLGDFAKLGYYEGPIDDGNATADEDDFRRLGYLEG